MLTTEEYTHIMRNWSLLKDAKKEAQAQINKANVIVDTARASLDRLEAEELVYINQLPDAIKEYEDAHGPVD